jgi:glycerol-3-phosphate acyltransferase PlsX
MKIALDVMGGDFAPLSNIKGAFDFIKDLHSENSELILVGNKALIEPELVKFSSNLDRVSVHHATQTVDMDDRPSRVIKTKPDSSLVKAIELVKSGEADAVVSAGNTGALLTTSLLILGKIPGIKRPALAPFIPTKNDGFILCDAGANSDVKPQHLVQFALMSSAYMEQINGRKNPRVALLNIGSEEGKGNEFTSSAYPLLKEHISNFVGNIESRYLLEGKADIVVCDGFTGNIVLKLTEGLINHMMGWVKDSIKSHPISRVGAPLFYPVFNDIRKSFDYEEHGGTPFLGVNGLVFKCHGASKNKAIKNALFAVQKACSEKLIQNIANQLEEHLDIFEENS